MNDFTIVLVDTETYALGKVALDRTVAATRPKRVLIYSDDADKWPGYDVQIISKITDIETYNEIIMKTLAGDLQTEFSLVIQYDGFVINPSQFSPHFLHYDYIGAPWPNFSEYQVGNGGFSMRSRRLVEAAAQYYDQKLTDPEDTFICRRLRSKLELDHGCRFASVGIAQHFSTEFQFYPWPTFGFHGYVMLPYVYRDNIVMLLENLPDRVFQGDKLKQLNHYFSSASTEHRAIFEKRLKSISC